MSNTTLPQERAGLEGVIAATTALSKVEGQHGRLIYRGYEIGDLARHCTFEQVAHLLWCGHLPDQTELADLTSRLTAQRDLSDTVLAVLNHLPITAEPMDVLRTVVSAWGATTDLSAPPSLDQAIALTARIPLILAAFARRRRGLNPLPSRPDLSHAAHYLYLLNGQTPDPAQARALDAYFIMLADHGMNASTFTARVVASTQSDLASSIVAAVGALKGPLHGGAPAKALVMLEAIRAAGGKDQARQWLTDALDRGNRLMGFGHRVYKTTDPRAEELRQMAGLAAPADFELAHHIEQTALSLLADKKPGRQLYTNVEYYSAVLLSSLGLPGDMFTPTFAASRVVGWTAHVLEQVAHNRLIRPEAAYTGPLHARP